MTYLLYSKKAPWSKQINRLLSAFRFILISLICFLLLGPLLNQIDFFDEKPIVVLAVDDSASVTDAYDSAYFLDVKSRLSSMYSALSRADLEVKIRGIDRYYDNVESIAFDQQKTNLHGILKGIRQDFEQQNLVGTMLVSDGIHNYGSTPQFLTLNYPVYSVGIGDTIPAQDLSIKRLNYNKVVYQGNKFPLVVDVFNNGYVGENITVEVRKRGSLVASKALNLKGDQQINSFEFILDTEVLGVETYSVTVVPKENESTETNNSRRAFIETVDSKQKILIAAAAPHPDVKALKGLIEEKEGTEVQIYLSGITEEVPEGPFDLIIMHKLPGITDLPDWLNRWLEETNSWYITGTGSLSPVNAKNPVISYQSFGQSDLVGANLNPNFELFEIDEVLLSRAADYPPLRAPYGEFTLKNNVNIYLYQKIGSIQTNRPLLSIYNGDERKSAVLSGSGIWKWKLQESGLHEKPDLFNEIFGKLIQYLATKDDKRNFRVGTTAESYFESESVEFNSEVYNELFEKVYDYNIDLRLTDADNQTVEYNYVNSPAENFKINGLAPGVYNYTASTSLAGKREEASGTFAVQKLALEDIDLTANFQLLRNISNNSGGKFYELSNSEEVVQEVLDLNAKPVVRSNERLNPIVHNPWILLLLGLLVSIEWFMRKYNGSY
ncbi:hypothetical protein [Roseivirga misakiensis]|uniref:VWFA domain-containing protein n=1 Tax=Roseivirga misakiensis TaxID=1563681 RepID=A0A1E5T4Z2_9BACT|nr:hypothetical protein [Roseivirga misakiensis]OEK06438.1 hypothetical protein BFP71_01815 [Roseivirga misakiensis]